MVQTREEFWEKWEGLVPYWMKKYLAADLDTLVKAVQEQERWEALGKALGIKFVGWEGDTEQTVSKEGESCDVG